MSSTLSQLNSSLEPANVQDQDLNRDSLNRRFNMIIAYGKEFFCILAFILTTFASVQNMKSSIREVPPEPFFNTNYIEEFVGGHLASTQSKVMLSDLSFVLYYSPWSRFEHSRIAFEQVSRRFHREAYFSAINCWQKGSECRNQYMKISSFPVLMGYRRNVGVQYQKNIWTEEALTKFISSFLENIERLNSPTDLLDKMSSYDALIVGFFRQPLDVDNRHYQIFYQSSLKFLEKDNFKEVGFAVVTGDTCDEFGVDFTPTIRAYMWNETLQYYGNHSWSSGKIVKWITENLNQVSFSLSPPGTKAFSFAPFLSGPLLLLLTPKNLNDQVSDIEIMLKQIAMEYYNCGGDNWVQEMTRDYLFEKRKKNRELYYNLKEECAKSFPTHQTKYAKKGCHPSTADMVSNTSKRTPSFCNFAEVCGFSDQEKSAFSSQKRSEEMERSSMLDDSDSESSPEAILSYNFQKKCEMLEFAETKREILFIEEQKGTEELAHLEMISGLGCKASNKTINFISIDSATFPFAERLGIKAPDSRNQTSIVIVDHENESTFLLERISLVKVADFLHKYHRGSLPRILRSKELQGATKTQKLPPPIKRITTQRKCQTSSFDKNKPEHIQIQELNSKDFENAVIQSKKTAVVFYYSSNCAFCSVMQHSLLYVARILKGLDLEFFRIDGDKNDLSWQFTTSELPSLLVFPTEKTESRKFPSELSINNANVLGFILANLSSAQRLLGMVIVCQNKRQKSTNDCIRTIQGEITETISFSLRLWRKHPRNRSAILRNIRHLREMYLNLFSIKSSCDWIEIQNKFASYSGRWLMVKDH